MKNNLKHILPFLVLMEGGSGLIDKSSDYVLEKFGIAENYDESYRLLDSNNSERLLAWLRKWKVTDLYSPDQLKEIEMQAGEWTGKEIDTMMGKAVLASNYTVADAVSDGVLMTIGYLNYGDTKLPVVISNMSGLADDYVESKKQGGEPWWIAEGWKMLDKPDPEDGGIKLRVIEKDKLWVIQDGAAITFLRPEDY